MVPAKRKKRLTLVTREHAKGFAGGSSDATASCKSEMEPERTEACMGVSDVRPNVRAKLPAEAGAVSLVRDDAPCAADQAYSACRSGSA